MNEVNRILIALRELSVRGRADARKVTALCASMCLGGGITDFQTALQWCIGLGIVAKNKDGSISLSSFGRMLLKKNPQRQYELTDEQRRMLGARVISAGGDTGCRAVLASVKPDFARGRFVLPQNPPEQNSSDFRSGVRVLHSLGVLLMDGAGVFVASDFTGVIRGIRSRRAMSSVEFKVRQREQDEVGEAAEEYVVKLEQERLSRLGLAAEATLVRRVSHLDIGSGYDIQSLEGDSHSGEYDRFIEVKASVDEELRFFWTRNEVDVAERLGDKYWIYLVRGWNVRKKICQQVLRLRNPVAFFKQRRRLVHLEAVVTEVRMPLPAALDWNPDDGTWRRRQ